MKKRSLFLSTAIVTLILSAGTVFGQDKRMEAKPMPNAGMNVERMHPGPEQMMRMAFQHNAVAFAQMLWDMSSNGKIDDVDLARKAFAGLKQSLGAMDDIHNAHMAKMSKADPAMVEKMKPMMEKMAADSAMMNRYVQDLENVLKAQSPNASDVEMHVSVILLRLRRMDMPERNMDMPKKGMDMSDRKMDM
jgi:hypothetical protein